MLSPRFSLALALYLFSFFAVARACIFQTIASSQTVTGAISSSDCLSQALGADYFADRFRIVLPPGQQLRVDVSSSDIDTFLSIFGPTGAILFQDDDSGGNGSARIPKSGSWIALAEGTYTIEVSTWRPGATGTYSLQVTNTNRVCPIETLAYGQSVNSNLSPANCTSSQGGLPFAALYRFLGVAGQQVQISMSAPVLDSYLTLIGPDGRIVGQNDDGGGGLNSRLLAILPWTGPYTIEASTFSDLEMGPFQLTLNGNAGPEGCAYLVSSAQSTFPAAGGSTEVSVATTAPCIWQAQSAAPWLTVNTQPATSPGTRSALVSTWNGSLPRAGVLTVAGQSVHFLQKAPSPVQVFLDVPLSDPISDAVTLLRENKITLGCSATPALFCPEAPTNRGQMAAFLIRAILRTENFSYSSTPYFSDVPPTHSFFPHIQKLRELNITAGCTAATYCPETPVTRAQMAAFLVRAKLNLQPGQSFSYPAPPFFVDAPRTDSFYPFIQKLREMGITNGCSSIQYCGDQTVTRGQMAVFLTRAFFTH